MKDFKTPLKKADSLVFSIIEKEKKRQNEGLELIPSESFPSISVLQALGSVLNNKYSEGYPGKRYYGGNEFIDEMECLAIERCKKLFNCEHANVQPYSGSPANIAVYFALLEFGDKAMGMNLSQGGHLTHGHKINFSGKAYNFVQYGVDEKTEMLDYSVIKELAEKELPKLIVSGATAYPREINFKKFAEIAKSINAVSMSDIAHIAGLIAGNVHPSPFPETGVVTTTTHKTLCGPRGAIIMCKEEFAKKIDRAVFPALQGGPHNHEIAAKAVALGEALKPEFKQFAQQIVKNAKAMAKELMNNEVRLVSNGTDNHLILVDLQNLEITGQDAETALEKALITVNKNMIPFDPRPPLNPSGIRLGTPAITCRGLKEEECRKTGELIARVLKKPQDSSVLNSVRQEVLALTSQFPLYD